MQQPLTQPNFQFKPKEPINVYKTAPLKAIKYDSIISSILTQATPTSIKTQSYRQLLSASNKKQFKNMTFQEQKKKKPSSPLDQTKERGKKKKLDIIDYVQQQLDDCNITKHNQTPQGLYFKTKSLYGISKQLPKSNERFQKQKSVTALDSKISLKKKVLLLSPEKTLQITNNNEPVELFDITYNQDLHHHQYQHSKSIRKRNRCSLFKERKRWNLENKELFNERIQSLREINIKIDTLCSTQDESIRSQIVNSGEIEEAQVCIPLTAQMKYGILNLIRAKKKKGNDDNRRINTMN